MIAALQDLKPGFINLFDQSKVVLFEIDDSGIILYCRLTSQTIFSSNSEAFIGRDFFTEITPFENMQELRQRFCGFKKSGATSEKFTFTCRAINLTIPARIMFTRVFSRENGSFDKTTIVDIRKI